MNSNRKPLPSGNALVLALILTSVLIYLLYTLYIDWSLGGNPWKQGDWLIHGLAGPIRRGPFGTGLLALSDALGTSPLLLLIWLQGFIVTLIFVVVGAAALKLGVPDNLLIILLSPAFIFFFWSNDPQGSMRKEILAYLAFLPLIIFAMRGRGGVLAFIISSMLYAIATMAHEANVFFLPFLWVGMWLVFPSGFSIMVRVGLLAIPFAIAVAGAIFALAFPAFPDPNLICLDLTERGLHPEICKGAIAYLDTTSGDVGVHLGRFVTVDFRNFLLLYGICLLAFRVILQGSDSVQITFSLILFSGIVFLPLYIIAGDYGRWLNFHVSAVTFLLLIYFLKVRPKWLYIRARKGDFCFLLAVYALIGISHSPGDLTDGFLVILVRAVWS
jgi:hypothetical protein